MGRAVEDFHDSEEYWEELLKSGFLSYRVGYEDARKLSGAYIRSSTSAASFRQSRRPQLQRRWLTHRREVAPPQQKPKQTRTRPPKVKRL